MSMTPAPRWHSFTPARELISSHFFHKGTNARLRQFILRSTTENGGYGGQARLRRSFRLRSSSFDGRIGGQAHVAPYKTGKIVGRSPRRTPILLPEIVAARGGILLSGSKTKVLDPISLRTVRGQSGWVPYLKAQAVELPNEFFRISGSKPNLFRKLRPAVPVLLIEMGTSCP